MSEKVVDWSILAVLLLLWFTIGFISGVEADGRNLDKLEIEIVEGDSVRFVTSSDIALKLDSLKPLWRDRFSCNLFALEADLRENPYIDTVEIFGDVSGTMNVYVRQKDILFRLVSGGGADYLVSRGREVIKSHKNFVLDTPIVTCGDEFLKKYIKNEKKSLKNHCNLHNLCNFVELIENDDFWRDMVVQIDINDNSQIELFPRVGDCSIMVCSLDEVSLATASLSRAQTFLKEVVSKNSWNKWSKINSSYNNLIIATK